MRPKRWKPQQQLLQQVNQKDKHSLAKKLNTPPGCFFCQLVVWYKLCHSQAGNAFYYKAVWLYCYTCVYGHAIISNCPPHFC